MADNQACRESDLDLLMSYRGQNREALNTVLGKHRSKLRNMVRARMNPRLQGRLDASDIVQDTLVEASRTIDSFLSDPKIPVIVWLRHLANEKLIQAHRRHLQTQKRDANRDLSIFGGALSATSEAIAIQLIDSRPSPSEAVARKDRKKQLIEALNKMKPVDREILTLRHFEHLTSQEASKVMGMKYEAVKKRYVRALEKLQKFLIEE